MGIAIAKSSPPPKAANTKVPISKGSQHYPKSHLSVSSLHPRATETSSLGLWTQCISKARLLFCLQAFLLLLLSLQPQFLRKARLLFCLLLCLELQPRFLSNARLLFCLQTCLLLCISLQPNLLRIAHLLFNHQPYMFFLLSLHP